MKPGSRAWRKRQKALLAEEANSPLRWWYLSFADDTRGGFQGAAIVEARGEITALAETRKLRINPGGQVVILEIDEEGLSEFPERFRNRLLDKETVMHELFGVRVGDLPDGIPGQTIRSN